MFMSIRNGLMLMLDVKTNATRIKNEKAARDMIEDFLEF